MGLRMGKEDGMTLVELLAAITILGIVVLGVMYVFPQMTASNLQSEVKLETMNLARVELEELKDPDGKQKLLDYQDGTPLQTEGNFNDPENRERTIFNYSKGIDNKYNYEVIHYEEDVLESGEESEHLEEDELDQPSYVELYLVHIKVKENDKLISETFGYVPYEIGREE